MSKSEPNSIFDTASAVRFAVSATSDEPVESGVRKQRGIAALDHRPRLGAIFSGQQSTSDGTFDDSFGNRYGEQPQAVPAPLAMPTHARRAWLPQGRGGGCGATGVESCLFAP
jgi:hypothetical protein